MKLKATDVERFMEVVHSCKGDVILQDHMGGQNFRLNLKSDLSLYVGIGKLLGEYGDWLELFADNQEDEQKLMAFIVGKP